MTTMNKQQVYIILLIAHDLCMIFSKKVYYCNLDLVLTSATMSKADRSDGSIVSDSPFSTNTTYSANYATIL